MEGEESEREREREREVEEQLGEIENKMKRSSHRVLSVTPYRGFVSYL